MGRAAMAEQARVEIRPIRPGDLDAILSIDGEIRAQGKAITYSNLTTEYILSAGGGRRPRSSRDIYMRSITADVAPLLDFSFVAELDGQVRGFILGQVARLRDSATELGVIQMIGVHPDYQRQGIGSKLIHALADKYRSEGVKAIRIGIDHRDKSLLALVEHVGFGVDHLIVYSMVL